MTRYNGYGLATPSNWAWGFQMAERGGNIIEDVCMYDTMNLQAAIAGQKDTTSWNGNTQLIAGRLHRNRHADPHDHARFLCRRPQLGPERNDGGVCLNIGAVPEVGTAAMLLLAGLAAMARRRCA